MVSGLPSGDHLPDWFGDLFPLTTPPSLIHATATKEMDLMYKTGFRSQRGDQLIRMMTSCMDAATAFVEVKRQGGADDNGLVIVASKVHDCGDVIADRVDSEPLVFIIHQPFFGADELLLLNAGCPGLSEALGKSVRCRRPEEIACGRDCAF